MEVEAAANETQEKNERNKRERESCAYQYYQSSWGFEIWVLGRVALCGYVCCFGFSERVGGF